jgi:hypothetical protein
MSYPWGPSFSSLTRRRCESPFEVHHTLAVPLSQTSGGGRKAEEGIRTATLCSLSEEGRFSFVLTISVSTKPHRLFSRRSRQRASHRSKVRVSIPSICSSWRFSSSRGCPAVAAIKFLLHVTFLAPARCPTSQRGAPQHQPASTNQPLKARSDIDLSSHRCHPAARSLTTREKEFAEAPPACLPSPLTSLLPQQDISKAR